jgi:hypothetical protein
MSAITDTIVLTLGSGAAVSTALGAIRTWFASRRSDVNIKIESEGRVVELRASRANSAQVHELLERLLADLHAESEAGPERHEGDSE